MLFLVSKSSLSTRSLVTMQNLVSCTIHTPIHIPLNAGTALWVQAKISFWLLFDITVSSTYFNKLWPKLQLKCHIQLPPLIYIVTLVNTKNKLLYFGGFLLLCSFTPTFFKHTNENNGLYRWVGHDEDMVNYNRAENIMSACWSLKRSFMILAQLLNEHQN